ncbi:MAG: nitroreductase [Candidatus Krumholzibacteriota bacterium]|nr:nitroreductase [Candidatus Krumholzibacteriota bacterium]
MLNLGKTILDGAILSLAASICLIAILRFNPRLFLQDYPKDVRDQVSPKTDKEKRQSLLVGIPFLVLLVAVPFISTLSLKRGFGDEAVFLQLFWNAFGVGFIFNLFDLLVLDWLMFCYITPGFLIIPGTRGMKGYKDYGYHFRAFIIGTVLSLMAGLVIAGVVMLL